MASRKQAYGIPGCKICPLPHRQGYIVPQPSGGYPFQCFTLALHHIHRTEWLTGWEKPKPFSSSVVAKVSNTPSCAILQVNSFKDCLRAWGQLCSRHYPHPLPYFSKMGGGGVGMTPKDRKEESRLWKYTVIHQIFMTNFQQLWSLGDIFPFSFLHAHYKFILQPYTAGNTQEQSKV